MNDREADAVTNADHEKPHAESPAWTGEALIDAIQPSPHRDIDIEPPPGPMPVRDMIL
jgi:hypothetical protein